MKSFIYGAIGALLVILIYLFAGPQFSNYRAFAESSAWLEQIKSQQKIVEERALNQHSFDGAGLGLSIGELKPVSPLFSEIKDNGVIILRGGSDGQALVLIPYFKDGGVVWQCIGGSAKAVPARCK